MAGLERLKKQAIAFLLALPVSCLLLSSCEGGSLRQKNPETTECPTEEATVWNTDEVESETKADGNTIPNSPEDGYTKIY